MLRVLGLLLLLAHAGCAAATRESAGGGSPVRVTDLGSLAGRWTGIGDLPGHRNDEQYIEVTLRNDGTYEATSARTIGFMDARGRVQLSDGRLLIEGANGARGTATLYDGGGQRTLVVQMTAAKGGNMSARLRPNP
jgi:hypothetical protein